MLLKIDNLQVNYGNFEAIKNVSLEIYEGKLVTILGANGAGKSTLLKTISGLLKPSCGNIIYKDNNINDIPPDKIVRAGISHCPEGRLLFPEMSVYKNLELGAYVRKNDKVFIEKQRNEIFEMFPVLKERKKQPAGTLSGGEQQMLAIGRAMMSGPALLMLDEPSLGLAPVILMNIMDTLDRIKQSGTSILLVEQNAAESLRIADYGYVLETGRIAVSGTGAELMHNEKVRQSYLGA